MIHVRDIHPTPAHAHAEHLADGREGEHARPAHPPLPHQPLPHRLPLLPLTPLPPHGPAASTLSR